MKKLNIVFTLIISSFFLFSGNVKANTYDLTIDDTELAYIENYNFTQIREEAIRYAEENNLYYFIMNSGGHKAYFFDSADDITNLYYYSGTTLYYLFKVNYVSSVEYISSSRTFSYNTTSNTYENYTFHKNSIFSLKTFVDTNYPDFIFIGAETFNLTSGSCTYSFTNGDKFRTLYDYYLANQNGCAFLGETEEVDPKTEIVTNFYILVIDKIKLLTNYIATDYIILSALVIFIFVAVIGLVRRLK